jgi:aquaporin Z
MQKVAAEALGTFLLVFAGCGAIVINQVSGGAITHVGIALVFGLVVLALIHGFGDVSGCHINPAMTLGFWTAGRFPSRDVAPYLLAQVAGALSAAYLLKAMFPEDATLGSTIPKEGYYWSAVILEFVTTMFLMFVVLAVSTGSKEQGLFAGVAVGAVIALEALFAGPISGASMNPARSLGPAVAAMKLDTLWVYLAAPVAGAITGVGAFRAIYGDDRMRAS